MIFLENNSSLLSFPARYPFPYNTRFKIICVQLYLLVLTNRTKDSNLIQIEVVSENSTRQVFLLVKLQMATTFPPPSDKNGKKLIIKFFRIFFRYDAFYVFGTKSHKMTEWFRTHSGHTSSRKETKLWLNFFSSKFLQLLRRFEKISQNCNRACFCSDVNSPKCFKRTPRCATFWFLN